MILTQIFSVISIILGIYILIAYFKETKLPTPREPDYHLGCFLSDHDTTHSVQLTSKISELQSRTKIMDPY